MSAHTLTMGRTRRDTAGFTLIELMVTVALMAILLAAAAPSFRDLLAAQRVRATAFSMVSDLVLARSEAVKRGASVTLTPASDGWQAGWRVTVNAGAEILSQQNPAGTGVSFSSGTPASVVFDRNGRVSTTNTVRFEITGVGARKRCISLDPSGRPKSANVACPT